MICILSLSKFTQNEIVCLSYFKLNKQRERTINYLIDLADKMTLSKQTAFLSILLMD